VKKSKDRGQSEENGCYRSAEVVQLLFDRRSERNGPVDLREWMTILPFWRSTMRKLLMLAAVGVLFSGASLLKAADQAKKDEGKKETIKGEAICGKCALKETKACTNVVIVTKDGKKTKYYLEKNDFFKDAHQGLGICTATKDDPIKVKVTGTVVKKEDKLYLTPTEKIEKNDD
jgi:hypothetical protein